MKLTGDQQGIEELKKLREKDIEYLKFLLQEAKTNTDLRTSFRGTDGQKYIILFVPGENTFKVEKE